MYAVLIILIFGATFFPAIQSDKEFRSERDEILAGISDTYEYLTESETLERTIEIGVLEALGHETQIKNLDLTDGDLWISYIATDNLTTKLTRRGILSDAVDLSKTPRNNHIHHF